jgi:hypothetical protein
MKRFLLPLILLFSLNAHAKLADINHATTKTHLRNIDISIDEEGKTNMIYEKEYEILKESASNLAASYMIYYNGRSEKIEIISAKSSFDGKEYPVDLSKIEDKPLASVAHGFDQTRQILISFSNTEIGAKIYIKYKKQINKVPFEKFYDNQFGFGDNEISTHANININSKIPLYIDIHDPKSSLKITKDKDDNFYKLNIKLIKPIYTEVVNEPSGTLNRKYKTSISLSSLEKWEDFVAIVSKKFLKTYHQELPPLFEKIKNDAGKEKTELAQLSKITSSLQDKIRYMGDWQTIEGSFSPRDLKIIADTRIGDCKDYASALVAIATKLGYKAQIVIVFRGVTVDETPGKLPMNQFNHAMTKITGKDNVVYWIDPTNIQTMVDGIFPDIEGKKVLVLDEHHPSFEQIPFIDHNHATGSKSTEITILDNGSIYEKGTIILKNEEAMPLIGATFSASEATIKDVILNQISKSTLDDQNEKKITISDGINSRIVKDIEIAYSYKQNNKTSKTNLGQALPIEIVGIENFLDGSKESVSDLYIGTPRSLTKKTIIKNVDVINASSLDVEIDSPWIYISRKCSYKNHQLTIDEIVKIYKSFIYNEDVISDEFAELKNKLERNIKSVSVIFTSASMR